LHEIELRLQQEKMTERRSSQLELMRMHIEALFTHDDRSRIDAVNELGGGVAPRFFLGRTLEGNLRRFRSDTPDELTIELAECCDSESETYELSRMPAHREEFIRLLASHAPIERIWTGPAFWFSKDVAPSVKPVEISEANADLLRGGFEAWLEDVPYRRPFMAMIEDGRAVSVCASVRITDAAHEAGVETLPEYRRQGHAMNVVAGWAHAVRRMGAVPLYSTSWDNTASQNVAARLGLTMFGVDFHIT
jgi:RimJ/RimL family protein N-acetyltransferase